MEYKYNIENLNISFEKNKKNYNEYIPIISQNSIDFQIGNILITEYALYLFYENGKMQKIMYQKESKFNIEYMDTQISSFILFVKNKDGIERVFYEFSSCLYNYDFNNLKIEYNHIKKKKNNNKLLIVFGSANDTTPSLTEEFQNGFFDSDSYKKLNNTLRIMPFYQRIYDSSYDIIYISDNFSYGFSWYLYEGTREIDNLLVDFLNNFIRKNSYSNVASFGSSKGAFAAINIGNKIEKLDYILALVPQISLNSYFKWRPTNYAHFKSINDFKKISENINNKSIYIFSGKNDPQYSEQKIYSKINKCNFVDLGDQHKGHNELVMNNYEKIFDYIFGKNGLLD